MKTRLISLFAVFCVLIAPAFAENVTDIRRRLEQRLPQIDALKAQEVVGETNRGLLDVRKPGDSGAAGVVAAENHDREAVYAYIAKETGSNADAVARARAKQISANSRPGVWVQDEAGKWIKK